MLRICSLTLDGRRPLSADSGEVVGFPEVANMTSTPVRGGSFGLNVLDCSRLFQFSPITLNLTPNRESAVAGEQRRLAAIVIADVVG
jgi:hypothetical protein